MQATETIDEINEKYRKWITPIQSEGIFYYTVWGADSTANDDDKLLIDEANQLLLFSEPQEVIKAILTHSIPVMDENKTIDWAKSIKDYVQFYKDDYLNSMDELERIIHENNFGNTTAITPKDAYDLVNFINLFGDYAQQTGEKELIELWDNYSVEAIWDYSYNAFFWKIPEEELKERQKEVLENYDAAECKTKLLEMVNTFKSRFKIIR